MNTTTFGQISASIIRLPALLSRRGRTAGSSGLRNLSHDQLKDVGIDPSTVFAGPVIEIRAPIMTTLMSLR